MDQLDVILLDAWNRISKRVRRNRVAALKRSRRRFKGVLTRPMREWCVVIRASDTRINEYNAIIEPDGAIERQEVHMAVLRGELIRQMTKPVSIPWPGVTYRQAAALCGREYKTIKNWIREGVFKVENWREFKFPEGNKRSKAQRGRPHVWTPSPIDPNNFEGRSPHAVWGTLWQSLSARVGDDFELQVKRVPKHRPYRGEMRFRGWDFACPGRINAHGERISCGRRCTYLYYPQAVWTLAKMLAGTGDGGFEMPKGCGLAGAWYPGEGNPIAVAAHGQVVFACKTCWNVRSACMANYNGWNEFIAQISGGLLYGRDVQRPADVCPVVRKKREYKWTRPHPLKKRGAAEAPPIATATA